VGQVVNLDVRKKIADLPLDGMPHLGSGVTWEWTDGAGKVRTVMASTNLKAAEVTVIDMQSWEVIRRIRTRGPGFFLRSHRSSPYAFVDSMMSAEARHILQVIDKRSLEVVKEIAGPPGRTLAHVEFTRDGRYALASLWEDEGAVIVYDAHSLDESQAPADAQAGRQVQRLEQDHARGRHQPLTAPACARTPNRMNETTRWP